VERNCWFIFSVGCKAYIWKHIRVEMGIFLLEKELQSRRFVI